ncbi:unnamed protein product [Cunninghamella blakesleeana]
MIEVTALNAVLDKDIDKAGRQDPYLRASLDLNVEESYKETQVHEDGGKLPEWNRTLELDYNGQQKLFIEILDKEKGVDGIIGGTTIPLLELFESEKGVVRGEFQLFDHKGESTGIVYLVIKLVGFDNSSEYVPDNAVPYAVENNEDQISRLHKLHKKELGADIFTGLLALGAAGAGGFLAKQAYDAHKAQEEEEEQ